ncbi:hypothetical protein EGW08_011538 [Elysia chlorotica]|uniref:Uncharacterized protein n=1 Tax=Elysia chlorotica TaxID=188477 RepID=A0A3S1BD20_ELYCH|nr:hypothetical protein EGW08_011538 [Elysia chlorotica]
MESLKETNKALSLGITRFRSTMAPLFGETIKQVNQTVHSIGDVFERCLNARLLANPVLPSLPAVGEVDDGDDVAVAEDDVPPMTETAAEITQSVNEKLAATDALLQRYVTAAAEEDGLDLAISCDEACQAAAITDANLDKHASVKDVAAIFSTVVSRQMELHRQRFRKLREDAKKSALTILAAKAAVARVLGELKLFRLQAAGVEAAVTEGGKTFSQGLSALGHQVAAITC